MRSLQILSLKMVFLLLIIFSLGQAPLKAQVNSFQIPSILHKFTVIAHRGDHVLYPENTLKAYEQGIKHEVDYVEIDLRTTKDSVLVIMHDETLDRMTDGKGRISDILYKDLKKFTVRDKNRDTSLKFPIPLFEEVLSLCKDRIHIYLDFKNADVGQSYRMIQKYGMEKQILVYINSYKQFIDWQRIAPKMPLMVSLPGSIKNRDALETFMKKNPVAFLDGNYSDYDREMVEFARKSGTLVWPDIQSPKENLNWEKALETGFTGLQTDHPEDLIKFLKEKGLR